ncbi:hypothetical protein M6B38_138465 [Iris pallida]|uniref:Uncharacterized protein n=1 Tax=Iris pallida TaxID=29817 RepID=A0AAX6FEU4_IRIPA|nr:hypothetical protein M6B38_138465 [Iris pallida]
MVWKIISVVIFSGLLFGWNNCRFCGTFFSFGLSRNRGNAAQIFIKLYLFDFKIGFRK